MDLLGKWTGVCYFKSMRAFFEDSTMKLEILSCDEEGNLQGDVTEICELPTPLNVNVEPIVQENVFHITGKFDAETARLLCAGEGENKERRMKKCVLDLKLTESEEKLHGEFRNPELPEDVQEVELHKGEVRRDLLELAEQGRRFLETIKAKGY